MANGGALGGGQQLLRIMGPTTCRPGTPAAAISPGEHGHRQHRVGHRQRNIGIGLSVQSDCSGGINSGSEGCSPGYRQCRVLQPGTGNLRAPPGKPQHRLSSNGQHQRPGPHPRHLFTISEIPIDLQADYGRPSTFSPLIFRAFDIQITGDSSIREFTLPEITIPRSPDPRPEPSRVFTESRVCSFRANRHGRNHCGPGRLADPFHHDRPLRPAAPTRREILRVALTQHQRPADQWTHHRQLAAAWHDPRPAGDFNLLIVLALFLPASLFPDQTPVTVNLTGGLDSITLFPAAHTLKTPWSASLTSSVGNRWGSPCSRRVSRLTASRWTCTPNSLIGPSSCLWWDYIPPTPANGSHSAVLGGFGLTSGLFPFSLHQRRSALSASRPPPLWMRQIPSWTVTWET